MLANDSKFEWSMLATWRELKGLIKAQFGLK